MEEKDIVSKAESVIKSLDRDNYGKIRLKTSQLRKLLSMVNTIQQEITLYQIRNPGVQELPEELLGRIQYLKIKIVYQAGRVPEVKDFEMQAELISRIDEIKTLNQYIQFARFMEALVAYHKYYGGKD